MFPWQSVAMVMTMARRAKETESPSEVSSVLARNTASFRRRMGLAQERLAEEAGLPRKTIYNTEKHGNVGTRTLEKLARVFGVPVATMLESDPETADAIFLARQVDRLSHSAKQTFYRSVEPRPVHLPAARPDVGVATPTDIAPRPAPADVAALFQLPASEWRKRLQEEPSFFSVPSAWAMVAAAERKHRVDIREAVSRYRLALEVIEDIAPRLPQPPHELRAMVWKNIGWCLRSVGEYAEAGAALNAAEQSARFCADQGSMLARVTLTRAILLTNMERMDEALPLVHESREVFEKLGDQVRWEMTLEQEAIIRGKGRDPAGAVQILKRLLEQETDPETRACRYANLTVAFEMAGDLKSAREALEKAQALHEQLGWKLQLRTGTWHLGRILAKAGDIDEGLKLLDQASEESRLVDDPDTVVRIDLDRCGIEIGENRQTDATYERLRVIAAYAIEKRLPISQCRALLFLQELGRAANPDHIRYVNDFIQDLARNPHREFVPPELAA
ncbi:MAG TPA: helix-turn-helix domain-containing protein [Thermoanaerobaculia bacterium]|nr:helix-turn-helix domain-containing protein [Thermoanaerobaculia bacterium]